MADSGRAHPRSPNLDQTSSLGFTKLAEVVAVGADERRRRTAISCRDPRLLGTRAYPYAPDPCLIATKICGELPVDERKDFNGSDLDPTVG